MPYAADNRATTAQDLILTGRSAASAINTDLGGQNRLIDGYLREGRLEDFARNHLLIEDSDGDVTIYDRDDSRHWSATHAPSAVIAADLARSTNARERTAGLEALDEMRQQWLTKHIT